MHGNGVFKWNDGTVYEGTFKLIVRLIYKWC
jgi:hypothetical protein